MTIHKTRMEYQVCGIDMIHGSFLKFTTVLRAQRDTERRVGSSCIGMTFGVFQNDVEGRL